MAQSLLGWMFVAWGWKYTILLWLAGLVSFPFALIAVRRGTGPMAALGTFVHSLRPDSASMQAH